MLLWEGVYDGPTGYIVGTNRYPKALIDEGFDVRILPLRPIKNTHPLFKYVSKSKGFTLLQQLPTVKKRDAYMCFVETRTVNDFWKENLISAKLILTESTFSASVFKNIEGIDQSKIHAIPYIIPPEFYEREEKMTFKADFVFGSVFEWVARKKPELMWRAFMEEFPLREYPNVLFLNRINIPFHFDSWRYLYYQMTQHDPRIKTVPLVKNIGDFYRGLDCYVSPTAGEGCGQTLAEAMACGIPTIGSRHSGNLDFMNDDNSLLVDVEDWSYVGKDITNRIEHIIRPTDMWKLPLVMSIRKQMRRAYEGYTPSVGPQWIRDKMHPRKVAKELGSVITQYVAL